MREFVGSQSKGKRRAQGNNMSRGVNKWIGIGNCCEDPITRYLPAGTAVVNITVACNESYKDKNTGQRVDKAEFVRIVFFNRLAEIAGEYIKKGTKVYIEGSLRTRKWQDPQSGQDRYTTEIVASEMKLLYSKPEGQPEARQQSAQPQSAALGAYVDPFDGSFDDDIPFS